MSELTETIADRIAGWPEKAAAELLRAVDAIETKYSISYRLSDDERAAVREALAQAKRGEFISDEVLTAYFNRFRS